MYDAFSDDYDRFVNWQGRLAFELPFLEAQLQAGGAKTVLDAAAGTGMHAIALAQRGYRASGADLSSGMVARARQNAAAAGVEVEFLTAGFGELAAAFGITGKSGYAQLDARPRSSSPFDALLCLGNSLPHLLTSAELAGALADFAACLRTGGLLLIQSRNFDAVMLDQQRWMEPQAQREGEHEWLFVRFYDFRPDGLIDFNILSLKRADGGGWEQRVLSTRLYPQRQAELLAALAQAGFEQIESFGGLDGSPFDPASSGNLVLIARKA